MIKSFINIITSIKNKYDKFQKYYIFFYKLLTISYNFKLS